MGYFNITNIQFLQSTQGLTDSFNLKIKFECLRHINQEIQWKVLYVADSEDRACDQELDSIFMNDLAVGASEFDWVVPQPDYSKIPNPAEIFDSTLLMIIVSVKGYFHYFFYYNLFTLYF